VGECGTLQRVAFPRGSLEASYPSLKKVIVQLIIDAMKPVAM